MKFFFFNLFSRVCSTIHCLPLNLSFPFSFIREKARVSNSSLPEVRKKFELRNDKREFRMRLCYLEYEIIFSYLFYLTVTYDIDPLTFREMSAVEWLRRCNAVTTPNCHKTFVDQRPCRKTPCLSKAKLLCADNYFLIINAWIGTFEICSLW